MLLYFINSSLIDINEQNYFQEKTCLHYSVSQNDIYLTKYLLVKNVDRNIKDAKDMAAIDYSKTEEMRYILDTF